MAWVALDWVAWPRRWSECIFLFLGLGFRFDQFLFWILFLGFLGLWKFEKEEWEKNWVWVFKHLKNVEDVNRVLKTRFTGGRHVEKVPTQT